MNDDPNDPIEPSVGDETEAAAREIARLRAENCALRALAQQSACAYGHRTPDGVCRLGYPGCACADDLIGWDFDRGPTLAADLRRSQAEVARLTAERDALRCRAPVVITMDADDLRSEIGRMIGAAMPAEVNATVAERDAYRAFAVRLATALASPGAEDLAAKIRLGDLDRLAEMVEERLSDPLPEDDRALFARQREAIGLLAAERDRLALTLRCERGEWAPEGWAANPERPTQWGHAKQNLACYRIARGLWVVVRRGRLGPPVAEAPTALEAIEAADAALREAARG